MAQPRRHTRVVGNATVAAGAARGVVTDAQVDDVVEASRVLVSVAARSLVDLDPELTLPRFRVLVVLASRGPSSVTALAGDLGIHPSNATRAVERLVQTGFVRRREDERDRRVAVLELTAAGRRTVDEVTVRRAQEVRTVLAELPERQRGQVALALRRFAEAAGEVPARDAWTLGWVTDP